MAGAFAYGFRKDFQDFEDFDTEISDLLRHLKISEHEADLILDLRAIGGVSVPAEIDHAVDLIESLPKIDSWRSFSLCATAFPADLMGMKPQEKSWIPRTEWDLWRCLVSGKALPRIPVFGDYAIANPQPSEVDPRIMRPSASIRYTTDKGWIVLKGRNLRDHGYTQFHSVSQSLVSDPDYCGPSFSWGDDYISRCANRSATTGNLTTWRKVGTSHHLAFVADQLANLSVS